MSEQAVVRRMPRAEYPSHFEPREVVVLELNGGAQPRHEYEAERHRDCDQDQANDQLGGVKPILAWSFDDSRE